MEIVVPRASWSDVFFGRHGKSAYSGRPVLNKVPKGPGRDAPSLSHFSVQRIGGSSGTPSEAQIIALLQKSLNPSQIYSNFMYLSSEKFADVI